MDIIWISIINSFISFTISESKIFINFREFIYKKNKFFGKLIKCGYCLGFWIACILVFIFKPDLFQINIFLNYLFCVFIIAWLSAFQWILMYILMSISKK